MDTTQKILITKQSYALSKMSFPFHRHNMSNYWHFPIPFADYSKTCFMIQCLTEKTREVTFNSNRESEGIVVISWLIYNRQFKWALFFHFLQNVTAIRDIRCTNHYFIGA